MICEYLFIMYSNRISLFALYMVAGTSRTLGLGGVHPLLMDTVSKEDVDGILFSLYPEVQTSYNSF